MKGFKRTMFTGIVEEIARIKRIDLIAGTMRMQIAAKEILNSFRIGDSVAGSGYV